MLTDKRCRNVTAAEKPQKLADAGGLYLYVSTTGHKSWRMKFRVGEKEKKLSFGAYPTVSLAEARERRDAARKMIRDGLDPAIEAKKSKAVRALGSDNSLKPAVLRWHGRQKPHWSPRYADQVLDRFEKDIFPSLGRMPVRDVTVPLILQALRKVEARGSAETAHRLRQHLSEVFLAEIASGLADTNPAAGIAKAMKRYSWTKRPAVRSIDEAKKLLAAIEAEDAYPVSLLATRLLALTAARPGMVRMAEPFEFEDLDSPAPLWRISAAKMKLTAERKNDVSLEFVIPLSPAAVDVVKTAKRVFPGDMLFGAPRDRSKALSDSTLSKLHRSAGYTGKHVPHGWRSTFSTVMNELAAIQNRVGDRDIIDLMLAHMPRDVESTYNRYAYLPRRRELALEWAGLLMQDAPPASSLIA